MSYPRIVRARIVRTATSVAKVKLDRHGHIEELLDLLDELDSCDEKLEQITEVIEVSE